MTRFLPVGALALAVGACSSIQYGSDFDSQVAFSELQTYGIMLPNEDESDVLRRVSPFLERRLERALHEEMSARGLAENTEGTPDLWVSAYPVLLSGPASSESGTTTAVPTASPANVHLSSGFAVGPPWGYPGAWGYPYHRVGPHVGFPAFGLGYGCCAYPAVGFGGQSFGGYGPGGGPHAGISRPGTLVVEILDGESQELIWQGWAENALQEAPDGEYLDQYVEDLVSRVLKAFPPATP